MVAHKDEILRPKPKQEDNFRFRGTTSLINNDCVDPHVFLEQGTTLPEESARRRDSAQNNFSPAYGAKFVDFCSSGAPIMGALGHIVISRELLTEHPQRVQHDISFSEDPHKYRLALASLDLRLPSLDGIRHCQR